uniref:Uncharacterized protein n=1 Tax=Plectus sambesii TaxID=2011161 RepID=A0A914VFJ1_9BILA
MCVVMTTTAYNIIQQSGVAAPTWTYMAIFELASSMVAFNLPLFLLMCMSCYVGLAFNENIEKLKDCHEDQLEKQLPELYYSYLNLTKVMCMIDDFFAFLILGAISVSGIVLCLFLLNINIFITLQTPLVASLMTLVVTNFAGYSYTCTRLNDKSREIFDHLHSIGPASQNIHQWVECFKWKVTDYGWGLTIGKVFLLERTSVLSICGAMTTFIAFYAQFNTSNTSDFKVFNAKQLLPT